MTEWHVEHSHGDAGEFHQREPAARRTATFHTVASPTLVLGSAQRRTDVDPRVAAGLGVEVVQRRSGGGAVLLWPGEFVWLDLVIPADDPLWRADVGAAMVWVGELWAAALAVEGAHVHHGGLQSSPWSRQVCFAGVGAGEVMMSNSKLVGISQRRTRDYARFQSMCHLRWRPELVAALVAPPRPTAAEVAAAAAVVLLDAATIQQRLLAHLP